MRCSPSTICPRLKSCARRLSENVLLPQTLSYLQKIMFAISSIWLRLFFEKSSVLNKIAVFRQPPREQKTVMRGICLFFFIFFSSLTVFAADEEFSFDLEEFEKKTLEWGGNVEVKWEHMDINEGSVFSRLNLGDNAPADLDRLQSSLQLDGRYNKGSASFNWIFKATGRLDGSSWMDEVNFYEAYGEIKPLPLFTASIGKKSYKWGKGYAWNPVGFINRVKDPNNPEEALEGYITTEVDLIKSFTGSLQTVALTTVMLPVWDDINDEYGEVDHINLAAKLYFLYRDTDIDFIYFNGESRSDRYGLDFSRNVTTNFEIHGELAYIPEYKKSVLLEDGSLNGHEEESFSCLLGIRYLSENDMTSIIEYYHNDGGYSQDEMEIFYQYIIDGSSQLDSLTVDQFLDNTRGPGLKGYRKPQVGRNYLYMKFSLKEPFNILYFSPALVAMINLDDKSYSISPELVYTGFTDWELRLRFSLLGGGDLTEFGEKSNSNKLEFRLRYFF